MRPTTIKEDDQKAEKTSISKISKAKGWDSHRGKRNTLQKLNTVHSPGLSFSSFLHQENIVANPTEQFFIYLASG